MTVSNKFGLLTARTISKKKGMHDNKTPGFHCVSKLRMNRVCLDTCEYCHQNKDMNCGWGEKIKSLSIG